MSDDNQNQNNNRKSSTTTECNLYDEAHSALAISSANTYFDSALILEFRPRNTAEQRVQYINDKSNLRFRIQPSIVPSFILQLEAFMADELSSFAIEFKTDKYHRELVFAAGSDFYPEGSDADMVEQCINAKGISATDISSDDPDEHISTAFIDYGTHIVLSDDNEDGIIIYQNLELLLSALKQLRDTFVRFDYNSVRLTLSNNSGGSTNTNARAASQPALNRPQANRGSRGMGGTGRGMGGGATRNAPTTNARQPVNEPVVDETDQNLEEMFNQ